MMSLERARVMIVEDDPVMGESLIQRLNLEGYDTDWQKTGSEALAALHDRRPDILLCDVCLPDMTGEEIFRAASPRLGSAPVLFITAYGEIDQAVRLMCAGASDYLTKPFAMHDLLDRVEHLLQRHSPPSTNGKPALGTSKAMQKIETVLRRVADIDSTLLFMGESGVGKEVAARFLHQTSPRADAPFMAVNCAAIPHELMESELFGHEKGAFTGAHTRHEGYAERARDGILFLDEVGELPLALQAKLLRLLQERVYSRVGGEETLGFNARLVCSTNCDLEASVAAGHFRRDLFYRINVIPITIPPLRDRPEDIIPLTLGYVTHFAETFQRDVHGLTVIAEEAVLAHDWPGNVRELRNRVERATALAKGTLLSVQDLFPDADHADEPGEMPTLTEIRDLAERRHIQAALRRTSGQIAATAELLGISRTTLWEKMRKLDLSPENCD